MEYAYEKTQCASFESCHRWRIPQSIAHGAKCFLLASENTSWVIHHALCFDDAPLLKINVCMLMWLNQCIFFFCLLNETRIVAWTTSGWVPGHRRRAANRRCKCISHPIFASNDSRSSFLWKHTKVKKFPTVISSIRRFKFVNLVLACCAPKLFLVRLCREMPCFPQLQRFYKAIHCELHICVFERNDLPAEEPSLADSTVPAEALDASTCKALNKGAKPWG